MITSRRRFFLGASAALIAAPAIIRVASVMPLSVPKPRPMTELEWMQRALDFNQNFRETWMKAWGDVQQDMVLFGHAVVRTREDGTVENLGPYAAVADAMTKILKVEPVPYFNLSPVAPLPG